MTPVQKSTATAPDHVSVESVKARAAKILKRAGLSSQHAETMAACLVFPQCSGNNSHGLIHLPHYLAGIESGAVNPRPEFGFQQSRPSSAVLDADDGPGMLAAYVATRKAIELAAVTGVGAVSVRHSGHFGTAATYINQILSQNMIGIITSNASPTVAPRGGAVAALGTNPIAAGFPRADGAPVIIDLSTSAGSRARIRAAAKHGESIPEDWALDADGQPTSDPAAALEGTMQALGGSKGTALGLLVELLSVTLAGGVSGMDVRPPQDGSSIRRGVSHFILALDPQAFIGLDALKQSVEMISQRIEASAPADPATPVRMPGTNSAEARVSAERNGIELTAIVQDALSNAEIMADRIALGSHVVNETGSVK